MPLEIQTGMFGALDAADISFTFSDTVLGDPAPIIGITYFSGVYNQYSGNCTIKQLKVSMQAPTPAGNTVTTSANVVMESENYCKVGPKPGDGSWLLLLTCIAMTGSTAVDDVSFAPSTSPGSSVNILAKSQNFAVLTGFDLAYPNDTGHETKTFSLSLSVSPSGDTGTLEGSADLTNGDSASNSGGTATVEGAVISIAPPAPRTTASLVPQLGPKLQDVDTSHSIGFCENLSNCAGFIQKVNLECDTSHHINSIWFGLGGSYAYQSNQNFPYCGPPSPDTVVLGSPQCGLSQVSGSNDQKDTAIQDNTLSYIDMVVFGIPAPKNS